MLVNNLVFVINTKLEFVDGTTRVGKLTANSINKDMFYVISPAVEDTEIVAVFKNYKQGEAGSTVLMSLSDLKPSDLLDKDDLSINYELVKDWNVWQSFNHDKALSYIASNLVGEIGVSFNFTQRLVPKIPYGIEFKGNAYKIENITKVGAYIVKSAYIEFEYDEETLYAYYNDLLIYDGENFEHKKALVQKGGTEPLKYKVNPNIDDEDFIEVDFDLVGSLMSMVGELGSNVNRHEGILYGYGILLDALRDTKVDKFIPTPSPFPVEWLYGVDKEGNDTVFYLDESGVSSVVKRTDDGDIILSDDPVSIWGAVNKYFTEVRYLKYSGGQMSGYIDMAFNEIKRLPDVDVSLGGKNAINIDNVRDYADTKAKKPVKYESANFDTLYVLTKDGVESRLKVGHSLLDAGNVVVKRGNYGHVYTPIAVSDDQAIPKKQLESFTYDKATIDGKLSLIPKFQIKVVEELPTENIETATIYIIDNKEFIYVDGDWEKIGSVSVDLSNYFNKTEINSMLDGKVDKNANITAGTHPKITYDAKGLVTGGAALAATDIPNLNASKINAGEFDAARIPSLAASKITQNATNRFVTDVEKAYWDGKQDKLVAGDNITIDENTNVISASGGGGGTVDWQDIENKPELYDKDEIDLMLGDIDSVLDSILDGGLVVGYNVSYKSNYFSNTPDWISITLTFVDDTTASYEINIGGTYPSDWEQQTGTPTDSGHMNNPYVWNNVKSVSITANSPGGTPYVIVNSVNVGATYNETLDKDISVSQGGGDYGGGPGDPEPW